MNFLFSILHVIFSMLKFVGKVFLVIVFIGTDFVTSLILSNITTESSIILSKYLPFSQGHVLGFQTFFFSHTRCFLEFLLSHQHLLLFHFGLNYMFSHRIYIYNHIKYVLLIFFIHLFLLSY